MPDDALHDLALALATVRPAQTPALVLHRPTLERNLAAMQAACDAAGVRLRAHGKMHKCSRIGRMQIAGGAVGLCCQTVGEAEAYIGAGVSDVLVTSPSPPWGAPRIAALARTGAHVGAVADDEGQIVRLSEAAVAAGVELAILADVDLGQHRSGCNPNDALRLARRIANSAGLRWGGVQAYVGHLQHITDTPVRRAAAEAASERLKVLVDALARDGLNPPSVTGGGTGTYLRDLAGGVFTELQAGSYAVMDVEYQDCGAPDGAAWAFRPALAIAATVVSARHKMHVTVDAGLKAISVDGPPARVVAGAPPGSIWRPMGDEHGAIFHPAALPALRAAGRDPLAFERAIDAADGDAAQPWRLDAPRTGDIIWLQPGHCDPTINLYDAFLACDEAGALERWPIDARRSLELF